LNGSETSQLRSIIADNDTTVLPDRLSLQFVTKIVHDMRFACRQVSFCFTFACLSLSFLQSRENSQKLIRLQNRRGEKSAEEKHEKRERCDRKYL
jgi:hypothetical protein